jgi:predicted NBD/HSP70 family sugar kinase
VTGMGVHDGRRHAKSTKHDSRRNNLRTTLELVSRQRATTRAEIARQTGLSRTAVSSLVGELIEEDLLRELGRGASAGGKPPTLLELNARGRDTVAVDLGRHPFQAALVDLTGRIHERMDADDSGGPPTGTEAQQVAAELIESIMAKATAPILGIGVGTPGIIDPEGKVHEAANLDWHGVDLADALRDRFGIPATIANDAAMAALAEYRRHPADPDLILIKLGRGIGAGLVLGGALYRGRHWAAGEIGHVRVEEDGERCRCGNFGCLETVASVPAIIRGLGADPEQHPWDALVLAGQFGEEPVRHALAEAGRNLGKALAGVVAAIDVNHLVLAPDLSNASDILVDEAKRELRARILPSTAQLVELEATQVGGDLVLSGAASAVLVDRLGVSL